MPYYIGLYTTKKETVHIDVRPDFDDAWKIFLFAQDDM